MKKYSILYIIVSGILFASCSHKQTVDQKNDAPENLITVTMEQFETGKLAVGQPVRMAFEEQVRCNGNIVADPSGIARISTPVSGIVKKINCSGGQKVYKGEPLFELSGNEFIELQKDLAETASQLKRLKSEYERIQSLFSEKIGTEKELIQAESEFKAANAKNSALKMKIKLLGLDPSEIENGNFYESFDLKSPINGYIIQVNMSIGQYADPQTILAEVFDSGSLRLKLSVFEKDMPSLRENQKVNFSVLGDTGSHCTAILRSIGKNVDEESRNVTCYAGINGLENQNFVNNAYVEATVITKTDTVNAIPEESVLRSEGSNYILEFVKDENNLCYMKRKKAEVGRLSNGYYEILNVPDNFKLITKGAYNIRIE